MQVFSKYIETPQDETAKGQGSEPDLLVGIQALPPTGFVISGKSFLHSEPQFLHLQNGALGGLKNEYRGFPGGADFCYLKCMF